MTLASRINAARRAVGDNGEEQRLICTIARKGIRFVGGVRTRPQATGRSVAPPGEFEKVSRPALSRSELPAIAVLPFVNMSGELAQEYFAEGISGDIITALSKLRWFLVIARNSSFAYKGKSVHMQQIAEELGVELPGRGECAQERRPGAHHCPAQQRGDWQSALGGAARPPSLRCVCRAG